MPREYVSKYQIILIMISFMFGSSLVLGINSEAGQDSWIAELFAVLLSIPFFLVYARLTRLNPETNIFNISEKLFGKVFGKVLNSLITIYSIILGALVVNDFSIFTEITALLDTPHFFIMVSMFLVASYMAKSGVETLGTSSCFITPTVFAIITITFIASIYKFEFSNLFPILEYDFKEIINASKYPIAFPFLEIVLFLGIADSIKKTDNPYTIYLTALIITGLVFTIIILRNTLLLGKTMISESYFPSYIAARIINIGNFITRIESSITMNFMLSGIVKISLCYITASKGLANIFNIKNYKDTVIPVGLLTITICQLLFHSIMESEAFLSYYWIFAIPFQIIIPIIIWIVAEFKNLKKTKNKS